MTNKSKWALFLCIVAGSTVAQAETGFYKQPAIFTKQPSETAPITAVDRFGPVGIGIELIQPAFVMKIKNVEDGSPAAATGQLKTGQIIETINGEVLHDIDPRIQLGNIVTRAEATDGVVRMMVKDDARSTAREVVVKIPVLGSYSKTWPLNCNKSDRIVRNLADWVGKQQADITTTGGLRMLFLLSTGEEKDLAVVRAWMARLAGSKASGGSNWHLGYGSIPLAEYYLRTGDASILPVIQSAVQAAEANYGPGGWAQRGLGTWGYYAGGRMNPAGVHVMTFLLLARECGAEVNETILQDGLRQYFRFAGRGLLAYGDHRPETSYTDNGRNGALAFTMAAAAAQLPDRKDSVYAGARDVSAIRGFYSTHRMLHGHSGGGLGEIWRGAAMGLLHDKSPNRYREFNDNRTWFYELSRRHNGSFGIVGGERYDTTDWGTGLGLAYTVPRRTLRITGAPPSKFSHRVALPERPWGTKADDDFYSLEPAVDANGKTPDVAGETMADVSASTIYDKAAKAAEAGADALSLMMHHQDMELRIMAAREAGRYPAMVTRLLQSNDARVRRAAVEAILKNPSLLTDANRHILIAMVNNLEESWYVLDGVLQALAKVDPAVMAPHLDRLLALAEYPEWWLSSSAIGILCKVAATGESMERITKVIGPVLASNQRFSGWSPGQLGDLAQAKPEAQKPLLDMLADVYEAFPAKSKIHRDPQHPQSESWFRDRLAQAISTLPGGLDRLYTISQKRFPGQTLPHRDIFIRSEDIQSNPAMQAALVPMIRDELIPGFVAGHRKGLEKGERLEELVSLYNRIGVRDYDWQVHGPKRTVMEWNYHSFDPVEPPPLGQEKSRLGRYRKVTYPKGMENWYQPDFDAKAAGWKRGKAPFASVAGKLQAVGSCEDSFCGCGETPGTLWEKEVLLLNGTFEMPPFKEGYRYRILIGGMSHVGAGDGARIYIDGKQIYERKTGVDRRAGGAPIGTVIAEQWWPAFEDGKVNFAATSFLKYHPRGTYQNYLTVFVQRMKMPPMGGDMLRLAAKVMPMRSSEWQQVQEPDTHIHPDEGKLTWDGKVVPNRDIMGSWKVIDQVDRIESFVPGQKQAKNLNPMFSRITFKQDGETDDPLRIWSGNILMDLDGFQALQIRHSTINEKKYLFIEAGGFDTKLGTGWTSPLLVLEAEL